MQELKNHVEGKHELQKIENLESQDVKEIRVKTNHELQVVEIEDFADVKQKHDHQVNEKHEKLRNIRSRNM